MSNSNVVHMAAQVAPQSVREAGNFIARLRRTLRQTKSAMRRDLDEARRIRSEVQALKDTGDTAHARRIQTLEHEANRLEAHHRTLAEVIRECGYALIDAAQMIDHNTTLAQRCDLLNVNVADRAGLTGADGLMTIIFVHALEDSAERRYCERSDGPLFSSLVHITLDALKTRERHAAPPPTFH